MLVAVYSSYCIVLYCIVLYSIVCIVLIRPPMPTGTVWKIGGEATVSWNVRNNHGGGYQYRLCPASEPLTEECFQKYPLEFNQDKQAILFANGSTFSIKGAQYAVERTSLPPKTRHVVNFLPPLVWPTYTYSTPTAIPLSFAHPV